MKKTLISLLLCTSALASSNDVGRIIEGNQIIMNDFSYVSSLSLHKKVQIAVIGDYVHPEEFQSITPNYAEIEGNGVDDDGNGYIDDYYGYDAHFRNGSLETPVLTGHENGIVSIMDAIISNYDLMNNISIIPISIYSVDGRFDEMRFKKMADSIDFAVTRGVDIISISQGISKYNKYSFLFIDNDYEKSMNYIKQAIKRAKDKGVLIVGSVSNDNSRDHVDEPSIPGNLENVTSVANVDFDGVIQSGYGRNVDIAYFGTDIFVWAGRCEDYVRRSRGSCNDLLSNSGFELVKGSSLSTPIVAVALAVVKATGAEVKFDDKFNKRISTSCSKKITSRKNVNSKCIFSPAEFTKAYVK